MGSWESDLQIEEIRIRLIYQMLYGFLDTDIRELKIPGDIRTGLKRNVEIKGWNRNGWIPIETWSVLEAEKLGWGWASEKVTVFFVSTETQEALGIPLENIKVWLGETKVDILETLICKCGKQFQVTSFNHPKIIKQDIQWSNHGQEHKYHSSCLFVQSDFLNSTYLSLSKNNNQSQYQLLEKY